MTSSRLDAILNDARDRVNRLRPQAGDLERRARAAPPVVPFSHAFRGPSLGVIGEVKRRSPSAGEIRADLDPVAHARAYAGGGAVAISVLTDDRHFGGSLEDLSRVAGVVRVPVLRKDFILDELQLLEARACGASAVLLIARVLSASALRSLAEAARGHGLGVLIEVHSEEEMEAAVAAGPTALGVNSRDLATFAVDLAVAERLLGLVPPDLPAVAESGIETRADVERLAFAGADAVLVGTAVARAADPEQAVRALTGVLRRGRANGSSR